MNYILVVTMCFVVLVFSCKNHQDNATQTEIPKSVYPQIIDSLASRDLYNQTKWTMYCFQCDDTLKPAKKGIVPDSITFGMLDLKFDTVVIHKDSFTEIKFKFYYQNILIDDKSFFNTPISGVVFSKFNQKVLYFSLLSDGGNWINDSCPPKMNCQSRFINVLQPDVIKYINDNKDKINPWFREEAIRKGVIKEITM